MIDPELLKTWTDEELLKAYEQYSGLYESMVGQLYRSIVHDEMEAIGEECYRRHDRHPNFFRGDGIVPSSWTDTHGLTHSWMSAHTLPRRVPDDPVKEVTCLECVAKSNL